MASNHDDGPAVQSDVIRRARTQHQCCGCHETIRRGDRYLYCSGVWEGRGRAYKYCLRCGALIDAILAEPGNEGYVHGFMCGHSWHEVFEREPPEHVTLLAFMTHDEKQRLQLRIGARQ